MSVLFQGQVNVPSGVHQQNTVAVPGGIKQPGLSLTLRLTFDGTAFPAGSTLVEIGISIDGGATFRVAGSTFLTAPARFPAHIMTYSLGPNDVPTHAWFRTTAPSAFNIQTTLEAL